jgi:hypothetical protein
MKDLIAQVTSENDPVSFLPKVVALLFLQVCLIMSSPFLRYLVMNCYLMCDEFCFNFLGIQ